MSTISLKEIEHAKRSMAATALELPGEVWDHHEAAIRPLFVAARALLALEAPLTRDSWCIVCGAEPGKPCIVVSDPERGGPGAIRDEPHFYRSRSREDGPTPPFVAVKDEA